MTRSSTRLIDTLLASAALLLAWVPAACADEVRVLAAGAARHAVEAIAPAFTRATGHTVNASFDTVGAQRDRVLRSEPVDVVVLSDAALAQLRNANKLAPAPAQPIGSAVVALAVPATAVPPDISTPEKLRAALLAAGSIAYADPARGATAGTHFARVLDALGLREMLQPRLTVLPFGGDVIEGVAQGKFALGVSQSSEIVQHPGVRLAGSLPAPHAQATPYAAARVGERAAARQFIDWLARDEARKAFEESGFVR